MERHLILSVLGMLALAGSLAAQPVRRCGYDQVIRDLGRELADFDQGWKKSAQYQSAASGRLAGNWEPAQVLKVSVVVHVVYNDPSQNISDTQVRSQLVVLNQDYRRENTDTTETVASFRGVAADAGIEFSLARFDPTGAPTGGITRTATTHGPFGNNDLHESAKGGQDAWDPTRYLNIWICNLAAGTLGYGTPPGTPAFRDGAVIHFQHFGTTGNVVAPFDKGRTATHEIGHWLGLQHLWGATGGCTDDDGLADTPRQESQSSGCQPDRKSCGGLNMVQNYMDYSDDACMNLFTLEQVAVMREVLSHTRSGTLDPNAVGVVLGEDENPTNFPLRISPNPATDGRFVVQLPAQSKPVQLELINPLGQRIAYRLSAVTDEKIILDVRGNSPGIYFLSLSIGGERFTEKIVY